MVEVIRELASDWDYSAVSIGYPGMVGENGPRSEPGNLGPGWVAFNFSAAFSRPVRIINDAPMQAVGGYEGDHHRYVGLAVVEAGLEGVGYRPLGEERGPAPADVLQDRRLADDVQIRILLAESCVSLARTLIFHWMFVRWIPRLNGGAAVPDRLRRHRRRSAGEQLDAAHGRRSRWHPGGPQGFS
jgi:hypothetical protein